MNPRGTRLAKPVSRTPSTPTATFPKTGIPTSAEAESDLATARAAFFRLARRVAAGAAVQHRRLAHLEPTRRQEFEGYPHGLCKAGRGRGFDA